MASIYKRGKIWWIKYHVKGSRVQRSLHTADERVARARRSRLEYDLATNGLIMPSQTKTSCYLTHLSSVQERILTLLGLPHSLYTDLQAG